MKQLLKYIEIIKLNYKVCKPGKLFHHNGNYDWEFKKIPFLPFYILTKLEYIE